MAERLGIEQHILVCLWLWGSVCVEEQQEMRLKKQGAHHVVSGDMLMSLG